MIENFDTDKWLSCSYTNSCNFYAVKMGHGWDTPSQVRIDSVVVMKFEFLHPFSKAGEKT